METQIITLICVQVETRAGHEVFVEVSGQLLESILSLHCVFWGSNSDPPSGLTESTFICLATLLDQPHKL